MLDLDEYIGIPFKSKGRDRNGIDCWGLVRLIYRERLNIELPSYIDEYGHACSDDVIKVVAAHEKEWAKVGKERTWDLVLLRIKGMPRHIGIVIGRKVMIHIWSGIDSCTERYDSLLWRNRILGFYRYGK
jgi:cell wall-associated NlpC family hydrolase